MARIRLRAVALAVAVVCSAAAVHAAADWNRAAIDWRPFEDGIREAAQKKRPALVIFASPTCPYCARYSKVFHDPEVVAEVNRFVPVLVDVTARPDLANRFMPPPGGVRTPTTFVLGPDGRRRLVVFAGEKPKPLVLMHLRQAEAMWENLQKAAARNRPAAPATPKAAR